METRCKNCLFWSDHDPKTYKEHLDVKGEWGYCRGIPFYYDVGDIPEKDPRDKYLNSEHTNAVCYDGSAYSATVRTLETFSCANFEQRV